MEIPQGNTWKTAENRTLKWGSSPPRAEMLTFKWLFLKNLRSKTLGQIQNLDPHRLVLPNMRSLRNSRLSGILLDPILSMGYASQKICPKSIKYI
jgi:hypothetical protein